MNRLANETSPYLLQHAENPVDWYPWGEEALERARAEDKPILLSIGYAACHWCHVMERESFEDAETAALMNRDFVSIKVDREERPDLDAMYMDAVQAMTGGGGWPLTAFLTPEGKPFYAGTYYPPETRHGLPAFRTVLSAITDVWTNRRSEAEQQSSKVTEAIERSTGVGASSQPLTETILVTAFGGLRRAFDPRWGGFGGAPKFPQAMTLEFCLRMHLRGTPDALDVVTITLDKMAAGGMYDQVGGGFHRYSTDQRWHVPHFEKMLYDNAQLVRLYVHAWQVTGLERYRRVATQTCEYLLRELRHAEGAFFSSQDADSEGVEGRFFVWTWDELVGIAGEAVATALGGAPDGNWEGTNVLWRPLPLEAVAAEMELDPEELARDAHELVPGPDEEPALDALAVRVLGGEERPLGVPELAEQVLAGLGGDAAVALEAGQLPGVHVQTDQQRVVVEHLLEVWDVPSFVRRVPMEAAAKLVVHPAAGHLVQRDRRHVERLGRPTQVHAQAELQRHGLGELRRAAEPSPARVERTPEPGEGRHEDRLGERLGGGPDAGRPLDRLGDPRALPLGLGAAVDPHLRDGRQDRPEGGEAVAGLVRVVGAGVEGFALRRQERGEGPSASAGHRLDGVHVDRVQVGAFLPVDLDRDEVPVHQRGGLGVLEALALHDVAPVTGGVTDREQDRLVPGTGPLERLLAPRVPVHGVLGVLEQVRARLVREAIHGQAV